MLEFFMDMQPLILDVLCIVILALIVFFGVIRGIKKNLISYLILMISLFLGFCSYTQSLKDVFTEDIIKVTELVPAGSSNVLKFGVALFVDLIGSLCVFLLMYLLLTVLNILIGIMIRKRRGTGAGPKSKVGRVFSGLFSLVFGGMIFVVSLQALNNNFVGMNVLVEKTTVTKAIVGGSEKMMNKVGEELFETLKLSDQIVLKIYKGDLLYVVSYDSVDAYNYTDKMIDDALYNKKYLTILEDSSLTKEEAKEIAKERLVDLSNLAVISDTFDSNKLVKNKFVKLAEEWLTVVHRKVDGGELGKIEFSMNEYGTIRLNLKNAGLNDDLIALFDDIAEGK